MLINKLFFYTIIIKKYEFTKKIWLKKIGRFSKSFFPKKQNKKMTKEKLLKYPKMNSESDFKDHIAEEKIKGKGIVVYSAIFKERNESVNIPSELKKKYERDIRIYGYRETSILFGRRIRPIPIQDKKFIKSKLHEILSEEDSTFEITEF